MTNLNETAKRAVDFYGVAIIAAETIESLSTLVSSIAHQTPYGHYQSTRIYEDIADACIHLEMMAYIATNDPTLKAVKDIIRKRLERLNLHLDLTSGYQFPYKPESAKN